MKLASIFKIAAVVCVLGLAVAPSGYAQDVEDIEVPDEESPFEKEATDEEATEETPANMEAPDPESIGNQWLEALDRLGGDSFADRKRASEELIGGGADAVPALDYGLEQDDIEVRERCIELLRKATKSADVDVREKARTALLRKSIPIVPKQADPFDLQVQMLQLQQQQQRQAALQRLQGQRPPGLVPNPPRMGNRVFPPPGFAAPPGVRPPGLVPAPGAIQSSVTIRETNGVRDIEVVQNGTKVTAKQLADGSITGEVTKTVDGKEITEKFSAKNAEELATKSPEAAERLSKALKTLDENRPKP